MAKNELEKRLDDSMALPAHLQNEKPEGLEHLTRDDVQMPRLLIAQSMSPQLDPAKPVYMEDLHVGEIFNSLTGIIYGKGPLAFTVLRADTPRWVEFIPRELGGGIKDPKVPFGDPRTEWQTDGKPPIATKFYDFIVMLLPSRELIALSFKSTGLKVARQLNGLMQARMKPIYTGTYNLSSVPMQNAKGSFYVPLVKNLGWVDVETGKVTKAMFEGLRNTVIDIHLPEATGAVAPEDGDTSFEPAVYEAERAETSGM